MIMSKLSREELIKALETVENSRDKLGLIGEFGTAAVSSAGSAAIASSVFATTATTSVTAPVLGSTVLGEWLEATVLVTTKIAPKKTVIAIAAVAGVALSYGLIKLIKSGAKSDKERQGYIKGLKEKIKAYDDSVVDSTDKNIKVSMLAGIYAVLLKMDAMNVEDVQNIFTGIENDSINIDFAIDTAKSMRDELTKSV